jgi:hypothetical protein
LRLPERASSRLPGGNGKIVQCGGGVELIQFPLCHGPYLPGAFLPSRPGVLPVKDILGALIMEFN